MHKSATPVLVLLVLALSGCSGVPSRSDVAQSPVVPLSSPTIGPSQAVAAVTATAGEDGSGASDVPVALVAAVKAQRGLASWYGARFHGQRTASGKSFDMHALTAAHPKLPLGSYARVTLLSSGKSVVVHITDRGPYKTHRIIDLSRAAAARLGLLRHGVGEVAVQRVPPPDQLAAADPVTATE